MRILLLSLLLLSSCSTLMSAGAAGAGAAVGSLAGPGGAAIGGAAGVVVMDLIEEESPEVVGSGPAAVVHETTSLVETVGLWYLLIFVFLPLLTKRGRGWIHRFFQLHDTVSKKDVDIQQSRLDKIESLLQQSKYGDTIRKE